MTQRTSRGHLTAIWRRLKRCRRRADVQDFVSSDAYLDGLRALDALDRFRVAIALGKALSRFNEAMPLPPPLSMRVKWTDDRVAQLRRIARYARDDEDIAREMGVPLSAAKRARYTYVGRGPLPAQHAA